MFESVSTQRKSQRYAAILAVCILAGLLILMPIGGGFADWLNASNAPDTGDKYAENPTSLAAADWLDMDSKAFRGFTTDTPSFYIAYNSSGKKHYHNVTHTSGVCTITEFDTHSQNSVVDHTNNISFSQGYPYFDIYFDYTAKEAYDDNVVRIRLSLDSLYNSTFEYNRVITLSAASITFYTVTIDDSDTDTSYIHNITLNVNDLRRAVIEDKSGCYFHLKITGMAPQLSIAGSQMLKYNVPKLTGRDDALFIVTAIGAMLCFAGIFLVQPRYSLPFGKGGK